MVVTKTKDTLVVALKDDDELFKNPLSLCEKLINIITTNNLINITFDFSKVTIVNPIFVTFFPLFYKLLRVEFGVNVRITIKKAPTMFLKTFNQMNLPKHWKIEN